jgi:hypothetical protein
MVLVLFVGAANREATPAQHEQLRQVVLPAMQRYADVGDAKAVVDAVRSVMGEGWVPEDPENQRWLIAIGKGLLKRRGDG